MGINAECLQATDEVDRYGVKAPESRIVEVEAVGAEVHRPASSRDVGIDC